MKKTLSIALILIVTLCACNRKEFVKKLCGTWKISHYIFHASQSFSQDETATFADTTNVGYTLVLNQNNSYQETYQIYAFRAGSSIFADTGSYDSVTMTWHITYDTVPFTDTTVTPVTNTGIWALINSEEDLELLPNSDTATTRMMNILSLTKSDLNLLNGNKEYDLVH